MAHSSFWNESIKVGNLSFPRFMAAPLDGVTDSPFRRTIRTFSPDILLFSEMSHVASVLHNQVRTSYDAIEHPLCFQFSTGKLDFVQSAVEKVLELGVDMINLNAGCPAKNVIKSGSGSALMNDLPRLLEIVKALQEHTNGTVPVTVKMRAGFKEKNALTVAKALQDAGVPMIIIHPRTQTERFKGEVDYDLVAQIKKELSIPLVFSGGISSFEKANEAHERTGVDGFMVGRPIWGAPWAIKSMMAESVGSHYEPTATEVVETIRNHYKRHIEHYGLKGSQLFKSHLAQYVKQNKIMTEQREALLIERDPEMIAQLLDQEAAELR